MEAERATHQCDCGASKNKSVCFLHIGGGFFFKMRLNSVARLLIYLLYLFCLSGFIIFM